MGECTRGQDVEMSRDGEKAKVLKGIRPLGRGMCVRSVSRLSRWAGRQSDSQLAPTSCAMWRWMRIKDLKAESVCGAKPWDQDQRPPRAQPGAQHQSAPSRL